MLRLNENGDLEVDVPADEVVGLLARTDTIATAAELRATGIVLDAPVDMLLYCPQCIEQHIDAPEPENGWTNPPHKSHLCHYCGCIWRPANHPTNGVASIERGEKDTHGAKPKCFASEQDFNDAVKAASLDGVRVSVEDARFCHRYYDPSPCDCATECVDRLRTAIGEQP